MESARACAGLNNKVASDLHLRTEVSITIGIFLSQMTDPVQDVCLNSLDSLIP